MEAATKAAEPVQTSLHDNGRSVSAVSIFWATRRRTVWVVRQGFDDGTVRDLAMCPTGAVAQTICDALNEVHGG